MTGTARCRGAGGAWPSDVSWPRADNGSGDGGAGSPCAEEDGRLIRGMNSAGSARAIVTSPGATVGMVPGPPPSCLACAAGSDPGEPRALGRDEPSLAAAARVGRSGEGLPSDELLA